MRVPEALAALDSVRRLDPLDDKWREEVRRILDALWLDAYEEGCARTFEPPPTRPGNGARHEYPTGVTVIPRTNGNSGP